jgi:hypothetical protein
MERTDEHLGARRKTAKAELSAARSGLTRTLDVHCVNRNRVQAQFALSSVVVDLHCGPHGGAHKQGGAEKIHRRETQNGSNQRC